MKPRFLEPAVFLISAVGIAYELALMRIFSIAQWHHFAYMIISIAMLGFGAGGTFLSLATARVKGRERAVLLGAAFLLPFGLVGCYVSSQCVPFETFHLITQPGQLRYLLALYLVLSVPFLLISVCITVSFFLAPGRVGRVYCFTMVGSGCGAAGVIGLLHVAHPAALPHVLAFTAAGAFLLLVSDLLRPVANAKASYIAVAVAFALPIASGWAASRGAFAIRVSQYKGLSYALQFPDARVVARRHSPLSAITAVASAQIRETPGQINNYPMSELGPLPEQVGLYFDAGAVSPVNRFDGDLERFAYLDYVTMALAYRWVDAPTVLVIGAGGGTEVLGALAHGARHVTAVEVDPNVFDLLHKELRGVSGGLYDRPDVTAVVAEGRGFLQSHRDRYDLIVIPALDSFTASSAGVYALNESYLYTTDALALYLDRLTPRGVLAITRWLKTPPRDALKLFATAVEACERAGFSEPAPHLACIRSWNNATVLISRAPLEAEQIEAVRTFCRERCLDACYFPGIRPDEVNRYTVLEAPIYYQTAQAMLSENREAAYDNAVFHIRPATDDRPYFFRFFKWTSLPLFIRGMGSQFVPFVEWGYVTLIATLIQGVVAGALLILVPLVVLSRRPTTRGAKRWVVLYFTGLGFAYMFLEIALIQRLMLFLAYPTHAVAVVLTGFLVFSGLGSLFADVRGGSKTRLVVYAVLSIAVLGLVYLATLARLFDACAGLAGWAKIVLSVGILAPLAFCMGIPFPSGLQILSNDRQPLLPWAWGINGCASVVGATLATLTAIHLGFRAVVVAAMLIYGITAFAFTRLRAAAWSTHNQVRVSRSSDVSTV
ncbi:MAG TPA: SAM-dependent methyltransferase [Candidatus Hydrogenedentes bacterium]|nr:SAM-dependent methyltransferase [Candidatus Hydrogenedentota bacterium]